MYFVFIHITTAITICVVKGVWYFTQAWKQTSGDPSSQTWNYWGITLLHDFMTTLLYMVSSVTMAEL